MIRVEEAEKIIFGQERDYGTEAVPFEQALGHVLAEYIVADRDLPSCNRVTMDGIAIRYATFESGLRAYKVKATIAAGNTPVETRNDNECVEIMTGGALPGSLDTVVRYEDVSITDGIATINTDAVTHGQNIHCKGKDKQKGDIVACVNQTIDATLISMAASVGKATLLVKKQPKIVVITTGDELVSIHETPTDYQVRSSNNYTIQAVLQQYKIQCDLLHIPDDPTATKEKIKHCLQEYDILLMTGGVSMGKYDYVPRVLEELEVTCLFHKVQQRPGKPFWFGTHGNWPLVFAFPGNPVSTFLCLHRYFIPWLRKSKGKSLNPKVYAILDRDVTFLPELQYFMQVKVSLNEEAQLIATPIEGNGSGDYANLVDSNAFMELPREESNFTKGSVYRIWPFKPIV